ncbi:hypothetical protein RHGRI_019705 [Rhododendron griersonianum]|uniref:Nudix hydrolase domain-containing protein n=1 Tax=Rhododendron griersonianum TaxID=479676 RepID=A0AAV6JIB6_9ERIC|nr:hypothetical protein RHGRI_019705 [Rhododendron griersonianum]
MPNLKPSLGNGIVASPPLRAPPYSQTTSDDENGGFGRDERIADGEWRELFVVIRERISVNKFYVECIPYKYRDSGESSDENLERIVEVLMINTPSGPGLLFPKGGWENDETVEEAAVREAIEEAGVRGELMVRMQFVIVIQDYSSFPFRSFIHSLDDFLGDYDFRSKTHQDEFSPEGLCRASMFALLVKEELESWPEQSTRSRTWLTIPEAAESCRHAWMREALLQGFSKWHDQKMASTGEEFPDED